MNLAKLSAIAIAFGVLSVSSAMAQTSSAPNQLPFGSGCISVTGNVDLTSSQWGSEPCFSTPSFNLRMLTSPYISQKPTGVQITDVTDDSLTLTFEYNKDYGESRSPYGSVPATTGPNGATPGAGFFPVLIVGADKQTLAFEAEATLSVTTQEDFYTLKDPTLGHNGGYNQSVGEVTQWSKDVLKQYTPFVYSPADPSFSTYAGMSMQNSRTSAPAVVSLGGLNPTNYTYFTASSSLDTITYRVSVASIPEPTTYAMFGLGLAGVLLATRRQRQSLA
jgi:PEP-CTERM motif